MNKKEDKYKKEIEFICEQNRCGIVTEIPELNDTTANSGLIPYRLKVELKSCKKCDDFNRIQYKGEEYLVCLQYKKGEK